ncbi:MAG: FG-GAP-like repeat-containing protein [Pyrinomonadaceae bacterium]
MKNQNAAFNAKLKNFLFGFIALLSFAAAAEVSAATEKSDGNNFAPDAVSALSQQARLVAADGAANDAFGQSVRISGSTAIVGTYKTVGANSRQGAVYIYVRSGATWTLQQEIILSDGAADDSFGSATAISGDTLVVGAPGRKVGTVSFQGSVYIYTRSGTTWTLQQQINSDVSGDDGFGGSVGINGDTVAVGADNENLLGAAYIFTRNGTTWTKQQRLSANDGQVDHYGYSISITGDTVVLGASPNNAPGAVYIYTRSGTTWTQQQIITASDGAFVDIFGNGVSVDGNNLLVGAPGKKVGTNTDQGAVYYFSRNGTTWTQQQEIIQGDGAMFDNLGYFVEISGSNAVVGAPGKKIGANDGQGAAYVYALSGTTLTQTQRLTATDGASNDLFGLSVGLDANSVIVGAEGKRIGTNNSQGAAYIFANPNVKGNIDFDGDGKADASVFRNGNWFINPSGNQGFYGVQFGLSSDKLAPADYDGDGKTDIAVWREGAFAYFYILQSSTNTVRTEQFGQTGDIVTVGDWDGDGKSDVSVYRNSAVGSQSYFYYRGSLNNLNGTITFLPWGTSGDRPMRGDFDGDGKADAAVFRPSDGIWYIRQSSNSQARYEQWGLSTDKFVPADYDGDGKTDLAVFRSGVWYIKQSTNNQPLSRTWGADGDSLVPGDYDGDGKVDVAVWRSGVYYILQSTNAQSAAQSFGAAGDVPIASAYVQ